MNAKLLFKAVRPFSFPASVVPIVLGSVGVGTQGISFLPFALALCLGLCVHSATNLINDYYDYMYGIDCATSFGSSKLLPMKILPPDTIYELAMMFFRLTLLLGLILSWMVDWRVLVITILGILGGYSYTGPPYHLKYRGLGIPLVFIMMGPLMVKGAYFAQGRSFSLPMLLVSLPVGFLVAAIMYANDIRDKEWDSKGNITTLAMKIHEAYAGKVYAMFYVLAYGVTLTLIYINTLPTAALMVLILTPQVVHLIKTVEGGPSKQLLQIDIMSARFHLIFGLILCGALLFELI